MHKSGGDALVSNEGVRSLTGFYWSITISKNYMSIGCQSHSMQTWQEFSDAEIDAMDPKALEFWRATKPIVLLVHAVEFE